MRKNLRNGADVEVAFASTAKRGVTPHPDEAAAEHKALPAHPCESGFITQSHTARINIKQAAKNLMRPLARTAYRLFKPVLRPLAFRTRRYLIETMQLDVREDIQRSMAANLHKLQEVRHLIHQDALASQLASRQELQRATANMVQELQKMQASLHRDVLTAQLAVSREIRQATAATARELQEVRTSLSEEVFASHRSTLASHQTVLASHQMVQDSHQAAREEARQATSDSTQRLEALVANISPRLDRIELYSYATARRVAVNCGGEAVLIKTEVGFVLCGANDHALLACLLDTGELERGTRLLIEKFLKPGDCFVDVGANIGMHTLAAARAMAGQGKIIAFEPFGPTQQLLERTIWLNGFSTIVEIHQAAVSNETGHHKLFLGATSGHHSLFPLDEGASADAPAVTVPLVRLDDVALQTQKIDLLKIDAEGAEIQVLESATSVIEHNPDLAIIVEFGPAHLERTGVSPADWLNAFARHGMQYRAINSLSGALEHWGLDKLLACGSINLLFSRKDASAWGKLDS